MITVLKQIHKWVGVVFLPFILLFALSGIALNHRELLSGLDVSRRYLPEEYRYRNWNNAAVRGTSRLGPDEVLIYGNIGVWKTDDNFGKFADFNRGFPRGIDNRKIETVYKTADGDLFAGTLFGLYSYDFDDAKWLPVKIPGEEKRIVDVAEAGSDLYILTRSHLFRAADGNDFEVITLPEPEHYDDKISLFKTLWTLHGGEAYGLPAVLLVDLIGLTFIFLSITGLILFVVPLIYQTSWRRGGENLKAFFKFSLKWHNRIGWITLVFLIFTTFTGMFLRPPLLVLISELEVFKLPFSELDDPNPWHDKLRRIIYDDTEGRFIVATLDGVFYSDDSFKSKLMRYDTQPPLSVMGVNVFRKLSEDTYLVGSFSGLYEWWPERGYIEDYITGAEYEPLTGLGPAIGNYTVTGYTADCARGEFFFDYSRGALALNTYNRFARMPDNVVAKSPISLWNAALEFHTARIYGAFLGDFYILFIPLAGLIILLELISGFVVWWKEHK
ncbi:MAG: iron-regulated protein [bacterium]|nr:iron-regulated protein [bacterium]